jgi:mono/diheme cytochrome c family protein
MHAARTVIASVLVSVLGAGPAVAAQGSGATFPVLSGNPARGRDLFVQKGCLGCHAVRGVGGKVGPDLSLALVGKGLVEVAAAMLSHYPKMSAAMRQRHVIPPSLTGQELDDVVAYLYFINFYPEPGDASFGEYLFYQKKCAGCHVAPPGGKSVGPALGRFSVAAPPATIAQQMWNHGVGMTQAMRRLRVTPPQFEGHEMADLLAFLSNSQSEGSEWRAFVGDPATGQVLFHSRGCARCHLSNGSGKRVGPDLSTQGTWYMTATQIAGEMWNHGPAMWERMQGLGIPAPRLEDNEMADLIAYLYLLRTAAVAGDGRRGEMVFTQKHCADCHRPGGRGPDLSQVAPSDTCVHFAAAMWDHAPKMRSFVAKAGLSWPTLNARDIEDLVAFLSLRRSPPPR